METVTLLNTDKGLQKSVAFPLWSFHKNRAEDAGRERELSSSWSALCYVQTRKVCANMNRPQPLDSASTDQIRYVEA